MNAGKLPAAVLIDVERPPNGIAGAATRIGALITETGGRVVPRTWVEADIQAALAAYRDWEAAASRRPEPREISHEEFWGDFVAGGWPPAARHAAVTHADLLGEILDAAIETRIPDPDALTVLEALAAQDVRTGIVSNTMCGVRSQEAIRAAGFEPLLGVRMYSDEAGIRKPNPAIFALAADALDTPLANCWYVGDTFDRDVAGGLRAGVGKVILLTKRPRPLRAPVEGRPHHTISRLRDLLALLPAAESARAQP